MKKTIKIVLAIVTIAIVGGLAWWWISPSFIAGDQANQDLDENVTVLASGELQTMDDAHWGKGPVELVMKEDGSHALYFKDVEIQNGPDLFVYLTKTPNFSSINDDVGEYLDLGKLEFLIGTFEIAIPKGTDVTGYKSVVIWCNAASIIFTYTTLE